MYTWIWRHLPGPTAARAAQALLLFLIVVALLFFVIFPWLEPYLPFDRVTQGAPAGRDGAGRPDKRGLCPAGPSATLDPVTTILVVDNYDSFVFNLVQYLEQLGARVHRAPQRRGDYRRGRPTSGSTASCCRPAPVPRPTPA